MSFRQENSDLNITVKAPDWLPDLKAQRGLLGRLATQAMLRPRLALLVTGMLLAIAFLLLAPLLVTVFYIAVGALGYAVWTRVRRLRMPRTIPLSHSSGFHLQKPREDLAQLIGLNLVGALFAFFGLVMALDGIHFESGVAIASGFGLLTLILMRMTLSEMRARVYFK